VQAVVPAPVDDEQALRRGNEGALHDVVDQADAGNTRPLALEGAIVGHHRVRGCAWQGRLVVVVTSSRQAHRSHAEECTLEIVGQDRHQATHAQRTEDPAPFRVTVCLGVDKQ